MFGERLARRALAGEGRHRRGLGHRHLGRDLVFGRRALQFLELQLNLIEKARRAFRARTIEFARQFLDPQLLVSYQRLIIRGLGSGHREFRFGVCGPGRFDDVPVARRSQLRLQRRDVIWKGFTTRIHVLIES